MTPIVRIVSTLALAAGLAWLGSGAEAQELRIGVRGGPTAMDPHFSAVGTNTGAMKNVYDTIVWRDAKLQVQPGLAERWRVVDPNTWEFTLRAGVRFHDGTPLTAADVKFSIDRIPGVAGPDGGLRFFTRRMGETTVVDDRTFRIATPSPIPDLPTDLAGIFVVSQRAAREAKIDDFNSGKAAIGTGPFRLVSWQAKGDMVLQRVNDYWRGPAQFERVTFSEITDDAARVAALLTGRVDLINYVPPADIARLRADNRMTVASAPSAYQFLLWPDQAERMAIITDNAGQPLPGNPLRDRRVRQALSLAIDRNAIAQTVMEGMAVPSYQLVPDGFFGGLANPPAGAYDPARARQLLAEAGYPNGFKLPLNCTQGRFAGDAQTCAALAQLFARIGIQAEARPQPPATVFPAFIRREFALTMAGWGTLSGEAGYSLTAYIHTKDAERKLGSSNNTGFSNPQIDAAIRDAMAAIEDPRRDALLQQAMRLSLEEHAIIPIVTLTTAWGARADRVTYTPRADEDTLAHEVTPARR